MDGIELMAVLYRVEHETRYVYASSVSTSQHVAYLRPRELPRQRVRAHALVIDPAPSRIRHRTDYFGNDVAQFELLRPHAELRAASRSVVEVHPRDGAIDPALSPPWEQVRDALASPALTSPALTSATLTSTVAAGHDAPAQFAYASPYVTIEPELEAFGRESFPAGRPLLAGAIDLMRRIHDGFRFDPSATTIATPVTRVLAERHGVCQDFAHLQISCLRSLGLAARYVSGYLLTDPPPGQPRLIGADASHAWLSVHCPHHGWVDLDPTNDLIVDQRHVTLAWGRDYGDVSPLFGVLLGGERHRLTVAVSVTPLQFATPGSIAVEPAR
jgi:transglutaminase-like putative cysteine protease